MGMRPHISVVVGLIGVLGLVGPDWVARQAGAQQPVCPCFESEDVVALVGELACSISTSERRAGIFANGAFAVARAETKDFIFCQLSTEDPEFDLTAAELGVCIAELRQAAAVLGCDQLTD
jgi:hypothetical protein